MSKTRIQSLFEHILNIHFLTLVLLGFSISYFLFFVSPIFFSDRVMQFPHYVPATERVGMDLKQTIDYSELWLVSKQTPYFKNNQKPPLVSVLFAPLSVINFFSAYQIITLVNALCYALVVFVFPLGIRKERQVSPLLMLVFITGLFSYGFQFELERGQFNVIAMFMCFFAIWIYHRHSRLRYLAYFLFSISVQLKIYPFIFIVMLVDDWRDWRNNLKKFLLLTTANFALLFVLGPYMFFYFIKAIKANIASPDIWVGNHSIRSFITWVSYIAAKHDWAWINKYSGLAQLALLAIIVVCILLIMLQAYRQKQSGINSHLLLACTVGALLIPSVSHDYTLSILAAPVAILYSDMSSFFETAIQPCRRLVFMALTLVLSAAYSSTLFSFTNKPLLLGNNFPALIVMLLIVAFLSLMFKPSFEEKAS